MHAVCYKRTSSSSSRVVDLFVGLWILGSETKPVSRYGVSANERSHDARGAYIVYIGLWSLCILRSSTTSRVVLGAAASWLAAARHEHERPEKRERTKRSARQKVRVCGAHRTVVFVRLTDWLEEELSHGTRLRAAACCCLLCVR